MSGLDQGSATVRARSKAAAVKLLTEVLEAE